MRNINKFERKKIVSEINVTPFVDVVLVLLIIFMLTSSVVLPALKVNLPDASKNSQSLPHEDDISDSLIISINKNGKIEINEKSIDIDKIPDYITNLPHTRESHVFIRADRIINYGYVMKIMTQIQDAGYQQISLVVRNGDSNDHSTDQEEDREDNIHEELLN